MRKQRLLFGCSLALCSLCYSIGGPAGRREVDEYGGWLGTPCAKTGHFHTQKVGNRWWLCTPDGHVFWSVGIYNVNAYQNQSPDDLQSSYLRRVIQKYGDSDLTWASQQNRRLLSWGFNTIGEFSEKWVYTTATHPRWPGDHTQPVKLPSIGMVRPAVYASRNQGGYASGPIKDMLYGLDGNYKGYRGSGLPDFMDNNYAAWMDGAIRNIHPNGWTVGITVDETDQLWGFGAGPDFTTKPPGHNSDDPAWMVLATSPVQTFDPSPVGVSPSQIYSDTLVYSKAAQALNPPSLRDFLAQKYRNNIAALNVAWGSNYTTFDSAGSAVKGEGVGTGNGADRTFIRQLGQRPVSAYSVLIKKGQQVAAGDCPPWVSACGAASGSGAIRGVEQQQVTGSINYSTAFLQVTFATAPPAGTPITVDYIAGGWGYGSGLMDEDGRHTAWMGTPQGATRNDPSLCLTSTPVCTASANPQLASDLEGWLGVFAAHYFGTAKAVLSKYTQVLYFSPTLGTWNAPARAVILQAAEPYVDVLHETWDGSQAQLDFVARNFGDRPITTWEGSSANRDSCLYRYSQPGYATQTERGEAYMQRISALLDVEASAGTHPFVGFRWWDFVDMWNEKTNWGLVSLLDNAYDGKEDRVALGRDPWGYTTGGEEREYGDFLSRVKQANQLWQERAGGRR
jgi:hypothetical protein